MLEKFGNYEDLMKKYRNEMEDLNINSIKDQISSLEDNFKNYARLDDFTQLEITLMDLKAMVH
jgi:hypothetical protein